MSYYMFTSLSGLGEGKLEEFLELERECLRLAYSPKPWLQRDPGYGWVKAKRESEEAEQYHVLVSGNSIRGYVYLDYGDGQLYAYLCPSRNPLLEDNIRVLLEYTGTRARYLKTAATTIWLGLEHSMLYKLVLDNIVGSYHRTWYYRMYYEVKDSRRHIETSSTYRVVYGGLELVGDFIKVVYDAFGEELEWLDREELAQWFKETSGKIIALYMNDEAVGAAYFHYGKSINGAPTVGYISLLGVKKKYRNQGIGKTLIAEIINYMAENNVDIVVVDCLSNLTRYYSRLDFKIAGRIMSIRTHVF